ncbi:hypothetical protein D9M72_400320 [compost metagenome]
MGLLMYISYLVACGLRHILWLYPLSPTEAHMQKQLHCSPGRPRARSRRRRRSVASAHPRITADPEGFRTVLDLGGSQPGAHQLGARRPGHPPRTWLRRHRHRSGFGEPDRHAPVRLLRTAGPEDRCNRHGAGPCGIRPARKLPSRRHPGATGHRLVRRQHLDHPGPCHGTLWHPRLGGPDSPQLRLEDRCRHHHHGCAGCHRLVRLQGYCGF